MTKKISILIAFLLVGCDGRATMDAMDTLHAKQCLDSGMGISVEYSTVPNKIWRVKCDPSVSVEPVKP